MNLLVVSLTKSMIAVVAVEIITDFQNWANFEKYFSNHDMISPSPSPLAAIARKNGSNTDGTEISDRVGCERN